MDMWSAETNRPPRRLWFAILGTPFAWALQGGLSWLLVEESCLGAQSASAAMSATTAKSLAVGIFVVALIIGLAAVVISLREWARASNRELGSAKTMNRELFLQVVAVFVSIAFTAGILWLGLGAIWLPGCERVR